jgi:hypothetical protein
MYSTIHDQYHNIVGIPTSQNTATPKTPAQAIFVNQNPNLNGAIAATLHGLAQSLSV